MTIDELLQKVHVRYEKNVDYPAQGSEDHTVRMAYANDALSAWEKEAKEGIYWKNLKKAASQASTTIPADFLCFMKSYGHPARIQIDGVDYVEVSMADGQLMKQENATSAYVFWTEAGTIVTLPAYISGTITFPYIRKATRYSVGDETDELDVDDEDFVQEYVLAQLYLDDGNMNLYNAHINAAADLLTAMRGLNLETTISNSQFGIGM